MPGRSIALLVVVLAGLLIGVVMMTGSPRSDDSSADPRSAPAEVALANEAAEPDVAPPPAVPARESAAPSPEERELASATWVTGRVVLPPGTPPDENVEVVARLDAFHPPAKGRAPIAPDGTFRLGFAPGTWTGTIALEARYVYLTKEREVSLDGPVEWVELRPELGGAMRGRARPSHCAVGGSGSIPGLPLLVKSRYSAGSPLRTRRVAVGPDTSFEVGGLPPGTCFLDIETPGLVVSCEDEIRIVPGRVTPVDIDVDCASRIRGTVVDVAGDPVPDAGVVLSYRLSVPARQPYGTTLPRSARTTGGSFDLWHLHPGPVELVARSQGYLESEPVTLELAPGEGVEGLELELRTGGAIEGTVFGLDGGAVSGVEVLLDEGSQSISAWAGFRVGPTPRRTDEEGRFAFANLAPGSYRALARRQTESPDGSVTVVLASSPAIHVEEGVVSRGNDLRLEPASRVEGLVTDPEGRPVANAVVTGYVRRDSRFDWKSLESTDADGRFTVDEVEPGEMLFQAQSTSLASRRSGVLTILPGETVRVDLALEPATVVRLTLRDRSGIVGGGSVTWTDGRGIRSGEMRIFALDSQTSFYPVAPRREQLVAGPLAPGTYRIRADAPHGRSIEREVRVHGEPVLELEWSLDD